MFTKGKPTWLLVRSGRVTGGSGMDAAFAALQAKMRGKVTFRKVNWEDDSAKAPREQFSLNSPPASVIADSDGRVVSKMEGSRTAAEMTKVLAPLAR